MERNSFKWLVLCCFSLLLFSCKQFNGYTINGSVKNGNNMKVYLEDISEQAPVIIDTTIVRDNKFEIKNYSDNGIYRLRFGEDARNSIYLFIQKKDNIRIDADLAEIQQYMVSGSRGSGHIKNLVTASKTKFADVDSTLIQYKNAPENQQDSLKTIYENTKRSYIAFVKEFIEKEENNDIACFALNFFGPFLENEVPYLVDITEKLHNAAPESKYIDNWYQSMQRYKESVLAEQQSGLPAGMTAPDIILQNPNGDTIQLSVLKGNIVLLDFWASWCQPCRMENPNVVKLYKAYHTKGLEIFSVSLDANAEQWKKAIAKDGLIWTHHGSDFSGWQSPVAQLYKVTSIPCTYLLDKKGVIVARNLRGAELEEKVKELLAKDTPNN